MVYHKFEKHFTSSSLKTAYWSPPSSPSTLFTGLGTWSFLYECKVTEKIAEVRFAVMYQRCTAKYRSFLDYLQLSSLSFAYVQAKLILIYKHFKNLLIFLLMSFLQAVLLPDFPTSITHLIYSPSHAVPQQHSSFALQLLNYEILFPLLMQKKLRSDLSDLESLRSQQIQGFQVT